jgi:hypothetical protein
MTVADLKAWPDDGWQYELVDGVLVRMPLSSGGASYVDVWHPGEKTPTTCTVADLLDGENVVPGFTYPVAHLFS